MPKITKFDFNPSEELKRYFKGVEYLVEADSFAQQILWGQYAQNRTAVLYYGGIRKRVPWITNSNGYGTTVGMIGKNPVALSFTTAVVNNTKVLFWFPTSRVVHYGIIERWLAQGFPNIPSVDASDFIDVINFKEN